MAGNRLDPSGQQERMGRTLFANRERQTHHSKHLRRQHRGMRGKARTDDSGDERGVWDSLKGEEK